MKLTLTILLASSLFCQHLLAQALPPSSSSTTGSAAKAAMPPASPTAVRESAILAQRPALNLTLAPRMVIGDGASLVVAPNTTVSTAVSMREVSRIAFEGARIVDAQWRAETAEITKSRGELRVIPAEGARAPINLILTTDKGNTYTLVLIVTDIPSQTILLKDALETERPQTLSANAPAIARSDAFERTVKTLIMAMASGIHPADAEVRNQAVAMSLWSEAKFVLTRTWTLKDLVGDRFTLTNTSAAPMRIAEQEFYKPGVHAVALDVTELGAGEFTQVYIVRSRGDHE